MNVKGLSSGLSNEKPSEWLAFVPAFVAGWVFGLPFISALHIISVRPRNRSERQLHNHQQRHDMVRFIQEQAVNEEKRVYQKADARFNREMP